MTTTRHVGSIHVDAPVEQVFEYVQEPTHFYEAMPGRMRPGRGVRSVHMTPDGVGSTYEWLAGHIGGFQIVGVLTREEYVSNERIVDTSSTGPSWTWTFEPDDEGTLVTLAFEYSTKVPLLDKVLDAIGWRGDTDLQSMLVTVKQNIEA